MTLMALSNVLAIPPSTGTRTVHRFLAFYDAVSSFADLVYISPADILYFPPQDLGALLINEPKCKSY